MALSLYDVCIPSFIQIVGAVQGFMARTRKHCAEHGIDLESLVEARLIADMLPFRFQVVSVAKHSVGLIEDMKKGSFTMPGETPSYDFAALEQLLADTSARLRAYQPAEIDSLQGRDFTFSTPGITLQFSAENYLLSFGLPNFYFHATTAYDILRMKGIPLGKRDFLGALRVKQ
jgi:hypothetical protein